MDEVRRNRPQGRGLLELVLSRAEEASPQEDVPQHDRRLQISLRLRAHLLEERVYPAEILPDVVGYRVTAQRCDWDVACNLQGFPCRWAFTRPEHDPFGLA